ncbi:MAG TPA: hypothetical protein ENN68_05830 [Methanomicrobia archaeon]|nr:hypothetical protein [Methanomicrobia archaeon]
MTKEETVSWFGQEFVESDAKALGTYIAALVLRFQVRYRTDMSVLSTDMELWELRIKPYVALLLHDPEELRDAVAAGKRFLKVFVQQTSIEEYDTVIDDLELAHYETFKAAYLRHVNRSAITGTIAGSNASALVGRFIRDVATNRFSKGRTTMMGSTILVSPVAELIQHYNFSHEDATRFMEILRLAGIMFLDIVPAPVLEVEFVESLG